MSIEFSVPQEIVDFHTDLKIPFVAITFGDLLEGFPTNPIFEGGPTVNLSKNCLILMMSIEGVKKTTSKTETNSMENLIPTSSTWMLHNCKTPWAQWYIEGVFGVQTQGNKNQSRFKDLSEEERTDLKERVKLLRNQYEKCIEKGKLIKKINTFVFNNKTDLLD